MIFARYVVYVIVPSSPCSREDHHLLRNDDHTSVRLSKEVVALIIVLQIREYTTKSMFTKQKLNDVVLHK